MLNFRRTGPAVAFALLSLAAPGAPAFAQEGNTVGPPQIRDFQLPGERRVQARPQPVETPPAQDPPEERTSAPTAEQPAAVPGRTAPRGRIVPAPRAPQPSPGRAVAAQPQDVFQLPQATADAPVAPPAARDSRPAADSASPATTPDEGWPTWYYLIPAGLLALGALALSRRRRRSAAAPAEAFDAPAAPAPPRPAPVPRPWLEIELNAERASSTDTEAVVEFELVLHNTGKSTARHIRVNARMLNAGREQDKEIGAFFRTKGEGRKTHPIGDLPPGERGLIQGSVAMPREEMRALQVNEQLLFIPVLAVNVLYDWGEGRTGQTSKSYVVGREIGKESQKMGAFRLDLGPRIYRTVGQREHSLAKRV